MRLAAVVLLLVASSPSFAQPATTSNADSCDIAVTPAATLLLPYFEVETSGPQGAGTVTLFTITNTSPYPQIAHVTLWTDWAFPVLSFNLFLTGYDVQGINLYDVIVRGMVAPSAINPSPAQMRISDTSNPNFVTSGDLSVTKTCAGLPGILPNDLVLAVRNALTVGTGYDAGDRHCSGPIGFNHGTRAAGYATVDVVSYCYADFPLDATGSYFSGPTAPLLFDNVLIGDYQQVGPRLTFYATLTRIDAQGGPMVHIRAIPEGGLSGASGGVPVGTNLPYTFYDRYTPDTARTADRRQPLPSAWAARYIQGGAAGSRRTSRSGARG